MKKHEVIPVPQGFSFSSQASGFRYQGRDDLALLYSAKPACFAGVFTLNKFQAAPVLVGIEELQSGKKVRAVMINAGQANACTGEQGLANCRETLRLAASALKIKPAEIVPASTGVIGAQLKMELWPEAAQGLAAKLGERTPLDAAKAIMTTDTFPKLAWARMEHEGREVRLLGNAPSGNT